MENVYGFPDRAAIEREAGAWLVRLDSEKPPTPEQLRELREWLNRSPAHREEMQNLAAFWGKMNVLTELAVPLGKTDSQVKRERRRGLHGWRIAAAAVCVLAVAAVFWAMPGYRSDNGLYATAVGQQQITRLADGSVIQLNTNSQIRVDFNEHYRDIRLLQGEAHFTVAKNPEYPFRVYVGNSRVQAVGTAFSVYLRGHDADVTVTEGRVALAALNTVSAKAEQPVKPEPTERSLGQLRAGQTTTIKNILLDDRLAESEIAPIETIDQRRMDKQLSWRKGLLMFTGDPLEDVVAEISRYTTVSIKIVDPQVRAIKIGGQFRVGETEAMLDSLQTNFGLQVTRVGYNQIELSFPTASD